MSALGSSRRREIWAAGSGPRNALFFFLFVFVVGVVGFHFLEKMSWVNSLYMTVITLSTVGFGEVQTLTPAGRVFTSVLIIFGVGALAYAATKTTEAIVESGLLRRRRMAMEI